MSHSSREGVTRACEADLTYVKEGSFTEMLSVPKRDFSICTRFLALLFILCIVSALPSLHTC